jgi:two-component system NarL family sensor kinase
MLLLQLAGKCSGMKYLFSVLAILVAGTGLWAQSPPQYQRDSMLVVLTHRADDTNKTNLLLSIGVAYANEMPDTALIYLERSLTLSGKLNYDRGTLRSYIVYSQVLNRLNGLDESIAASEKAIALAKKLGDKDNLVGAYFNIAGSYIQEGAFEMALKFFLQAGVVVDQLHSARRACQLYANLSYVYQACAQPQRAYKYGLMAVKLADSLHNMPALYGALSKTASALSDLKKYDTAVVVMQEAKRLCLQNHGDDFTLVSILINTNKIFKKMRRYDLLLDNAVMAQRLAERINMSEGGCESLIEQGAYYFFKKDFARANTFLTQALEIAAQRGRPQAVDECYMLLSDVEIGLGNMPEYLTYRHLSDSINETIISDNIVRNTQELETKYNVAKKDHEIKEQQSALRQKRLQNTILAVALLLAIVLVVSGLMVYRNKRRLLLSRQALQQQKIDRLETERQLLATESVMQGQEEERSRLAKDLHDGLGGILSGAKYSLSNMKENLVVTPENAAAFERTMNMLDMSITEMRRVAHNMMPESLMKLNLNEALLDYCEQVTDSGAVAIDYQSSEMDKLVLTDTQKITVYRIVQELINNIVKHAAASSVIVQVFAKESVLYVTVEDNGKGFDKARLAFSSGIGYRNIQNRIDYLNGKLDVRSEPGNGTAVYVEIPLQ